MSKPSMTLFTWPEGLFPRRITLYLKAKKIPQHILDAHLKVINYKLDFDAGGIIPVNEPESEKPEGSWPCMIVHASKPGEKDTIIRESISILEFLEEVFHGYGRPLLGADARSRAHNRDLVRLIDESILWGSIYIRNASQSAHFWSGLADKDRTRIAGEDGRTQWHRRFARLEQWAFDGEDGPWLGSGTGPMLPDIALAACVIYVKQMSNRDQLHGFTKLERWFEEYKAHESFTEEPRIPENVRIGDDYEF